MRRGLNLWDRQDVRPRAHLFGFLFKNIVVVRRNVKIFLYICF